MVKKISATKEEDLYINQNKSGLFLSVVFVLLLFAILSLSIWVSQLSKTSQNVNSKFESRLTILEEQLQLADSTSTEFLSDIINADIEAPRRDPIKNSFIKLFFK